MMIKKFKSGKRFFYANCSEEFIQYKLNYERFKGKFDINKRFYSVGLIKRLLDIFIKCDLVNNCGVHVEVKSTMDKLVWDRDDFQISKREAIACDFIAYVYISQVKIGDDIADIYIPKYYRNISLNEDFMDTMSHRTKSSSRVFKKLERCKAIDILKVSKDKFFSQEQIDILEDRFNPIKKRGWGVS